MKLKNEPKIGLEFRLQRLIVVTSILAVVIMVSVFVYTNLSSRTDSMADTMTSGNTISGGIYCDVDQDGEQDNFEKDLENVKVYLYEDSDGDGVIDAGESIIDSTTTNTYGQYSFTTSYSSGAGSFSTSISSNNDDAEEKSNGDIYRNKDYQKMNDRTVALRFRNVTIPQGTTINSASVQVNAWSSNSSTATSKIYGEDVDDSPTISSSDDDITDRNKTSASVTWTTSSWSADQNYNSPDIASIIQEIVNRSGWQSGNDITILIYKVSGSSSRKITARDYSSSYAPSLTISYGSSSSSGSTNNYIVKADTSSYTGSTVTTNETIAVSFNSDGNTNDENNFGIANACGNNGKNKIRGKLYNDANKNGVNDSGESGCNGVKVRLHRDSDGSGTLNSGDECIDSATTNGSGKYDFIVDYSSGSSTTSLEESLSHDDNDAEENEDGDVYRGDNDLDLNEHTVGLRYTSLAIPQGATITSAYIKFRAQDNSSSSSASVKIYGEDVDDASSYSSDDEDITDRTRTSAYKTWSMPRFYSNNYYDSDDISSIIQEIVNRSGWESGNDMSFIFVPHSGEDRDALSRDESSSSAPKLYVTYTTGSSSANSNAYIIEIDSSTVENTTNCTVPVSFTNSGSQTEETESGVYDASALPVELLYFEASYGSGSTELVWATAMEENNSHFEVERSLDGRVFEHIGSEPGYGNSSNIVEYMFIDPMVPGQKAPIYYRLKQVDYDGKYEYSAVIHVLTDGEANTRVYPVPANNFINVSKSGYRFQAALIDQSGNTIDFREMEMDNAQFATDNLPNGFYIVQIESREGIESFKVLVKH